MRRSRLALGLGVAIVLASLGPAHAHRAAPDPAPPLAPRAEAVATPALIWRAAAAPTRVPWDALAAVALAALAAGRRPRAAVALALVLGLGALSFESGVHSVHHIGERDADCAVAVTAQHLAGAGADGLPALAPEPRGGHVAALAAPPLARSADRAPDRGRAPPARG